MKKPGIAKLLDGNLNYNRMNSFNCEQKYRCTDDVFMLLYTAVTVIRAEGKMSTENTK